MFNNLTPINNETFSKWKQKRKAFQAEEEEKEAQRIAALWKSGRQILGEITGKEIFLYDQQKRYISNADDDDGNNDDLDGGVYVTADDYNTRENLELSNDENLNGNINKETEEEEEENQQKILSLNGKN